MSTKRKRGDNMLSTEKITRAFTAICEEAEKLIMAGPPDHVRDGLSRIISIAKHQNDIRNATQGKLQSHPYPLK
jgi:hypothetical protein